MEFDTDTNNFYKNTNEQTRKAKQLHTDNTLTISSIPPFPRQQ